jgi:hypothetical protein
MIINKIKSKNMCISNEIIQEEISYPLKCILIIDLFILAATIFITYYDGGNSYFSYLVRRYTTPFHLGLEMNIAVWWSGILIATAAFIGYENFCEKRSKDSYAWFLLSIVLICLSIDEVCSIHERIGEFKKFIPYALILFILFIIAFISLEINKNTRKSGLFIFSGFICYGSVAVQEKIEHALTWPYWISGIRIGVEEGTELLGSFLILLGVIYHRQIAQSRSMHSSVAPVIPDPGRLKALGGFLFVGLVVNFGVAIFIIPSLDDIGIRGNPAIWYPTIIYFLVFCALFWNALRSYEKQKMITYYASFIFLILSIYCMYPLYKFIPFISRIPIPYSDIILEHSIIFIMQLIGMMIIVINHEHSRSQYVYVIITSILVILSFYLNTLVNQMIILSLSSYLVLDMMLSYNYEFSKEITFPMSSLIKSITRV